MKALIASKLAAPLVAGSLFLVGGPCLAAQAAASAACPGAGSAPSGPCADTTRYGPHGTAGNMGMGMGQGAGMGQGMGMAGPAPMSLMTPDERAEHQRRMSSFKSFEECRAYVDDLHKKMAVRAKERGVAMPTAPARDPCAGLPRLKP